ncbi:GyrI-like domain-containing protein [Halobacteriovorax sp. CON-3]|uniref:AraC family transcriptional regulator n=1 Tax=Halobacteriovorax sp. CON-3 TaxID=3157710 RepID=UPI00372008D3
MTKIIQTHFHKMQLAKAKKFIRSKLAEKVSLDEVAKASGASIYHFIRVFAAYTGETPFSYIRRERIVESLRLLEENQNITDVSLAIGFETPSSFNKAFKRETQVSPSEFRNLGKAERDKIFNNLRMGPKKKEIIMNINMEMKPEIIIRHKTVIYGYEAQDASFKDAAQIAWQEFLQILSKVQEDLSQSEFLGVGDIINEECTYQAAISLPTNESAIIPKLTRSEIPASKYAKFLLKGSYDGIWFAFDKAFKFINEGDYEIGDAPCLEVYLNDPSITPEDELMTEILIPIK